MPPKGFIDPITSDGTEFRSNTPINELMEHVTRAIKANDVNSTPPIAETTDAATVMKNELTLDQIPAMRGGSSHSILDRETEA